jgi:hypothetical protein
MRVFRVLLPIHVAKLGGSVMRLLVFIGVLGVGLIAAATASAAVTVSAGDGTVVADGSATVPVTIACTPGSRVLEAHLTLSQNDQAVSGTAGISGVRCNGRPATYLVTVRPNEGSFQAGTAFASPFVLVQRRGTGETESGGTSAEITLHASDSA